MKEELENLDLENVPDTLFVRQSDAARLLAKFKNRPSITRQYIGRLLVHPIHSGTIRTEGKNVNLYDILHLEPLKPGRPRKYEERNAAEQ